MTPDERVRFAERLGEEARVVHACTGDLLVPLTAMDTEPVRRVLDDLGARYALIGVHAMAARSYLRFTIDVAS